MGIQNNNFEVIPVDMDFKMKKELPNRIERHSFKDDNIALQFFRSKLREYFGEIFDQIIFEDTDAHLIVERGSKSIVLEHISEPFNEKHNRSVWIGPSGNS